MVLFQSEDELEKILKRTFKQNCIQNKNCKSYELLLSAAIESGLVKLSDCKKQLNEEFEGIFPLQVIDHRDEVYTSVYSLCKDIINCNKIILKIIPKLKSDLHGLPEVGHPANAEKRLLKLFTKELVLKNITPNIAIYYSGMECNIYSEKIQHLPESYNIANLRPMNGKVKMIFAEYIEGLGFADFIRTYFSKKNASGSESISKLQSILFQLLFTLLILQERYNFMHNDLHGQNVLLKRTYNKKSDRKYWVYNLNKRKYYVPDLGFQVKLWDFDFSRTFKGKIIKNTKVDSGYYLKYGIVSEFNYAYDYFYLLSEIKRINSKKLKDFLKRIGIFRVPSLRTFEKRLIASPSEYNLPTIDQILYMPFFDSLREKPITGSVLGEFNSIMK